uniref:Uncharacterized protein n=1 Tax=Glossina austeni TaxID=7395 RepID=A0A1A9VL33_GLOAU
MRPIREIIYLYINSYVNVQRNNLFPTSTNCLTKKDCECSYRGNLTLELIKEINLNNTKSIVLLDTERKMGDIICYTLVILTIFPIFCLSLRKLRKSEKLRVPEDINIDILLPFKKIVSNQSESGKTPTLTIKNNR